MIRENLILQPFLVLALLIVGFFSLAVLGCGLLNVLGTSSLLWETFM